MTSLVDVSWLSVDNDSDVMYDVMYDVISGELATVDSWRPE